jgi:uncharacterized protein
MTQAAKAQEPSMEEILASIRRIIADDDASKTAQRDSEGPKAAPSSVAAAGASAVASSAPSLAASRTEASAPKGIQSIDDQASDILDLTESMAAPPVAGPGPPSQFRRIEGHADVGFDEALEKTPIEARGQAARAAGYSQPRLLSSETTAAVDSAFNTLAQTVLVQNGRTLEDLVREMLRPMLKGWLDENLAGLVERLVRAEIERVSRGHG